MRTFRPGLTVSILAFLSCLLLLTWLLFSLFAFRTAANDLYAQKAQHARMLLTTFVSQLPETIPIFPDGLISPDLPAAVYVQSLAGAEDFIRLTLLDVNDKCIYTAGREGVDVYAPFAGSLQRGTGSFMTGDGSAISWVSQVTRNGAVVGRAGLVLSLSNENSRLSRSRQLFLSYFAIDFILLLGFGAFILSRIFVRPINYLLTATEKITDGHYGQPVRVSGSSEMVRLAESFNSMSETLFMKDQQVKAQVAVLEKANFELGQAREEALRSDKMASIGLLAAGMAHEVGTPLASIMGYAELLSGESFGNPESGDYVRRISQDCARIDRIIRGLLDYSRPRDSVVEPVDVREIVTHSLELMSQQGVFKLIKVTTMIDNPLPLAKADSHQLQQVLINLLLNSRDAISDYGKIVVRAKLEKAVQLPAFPAGCMRIDVLDNGAGIPQQHLGQLFEPFFTTKPPGKGTGLGLAISARIIEGFGGRITVKSTIGRGSCFTVWLPVELAEETRQ